MLEHECGFRSFEPTNFYQIIDNEGCLHNAYFSTNRYANDDRALFTLCELSLYNGKWIVDDEYEVITVNMVKFWKPLQMPNWAQEKIYQQEMDKIRFCGCGMSTLIEKLRNRRKEWASNPHYWMDSNLISDVFNDVIDIVKQHEAESDVQDD